MAQATLSPAVHLAGLTVAPVSLVSSLGKDVLMIKCFDSVDTATGKARRTAMEDNWVTVISCVSLQLPEIERAR
ncbi:MAG: hypothetical protein BMS9Abin08_0672 [Gammaproteobacteria bacterium]|nr:MAG: hypothetical protein BMS9Abin08_0672 [Gammaproteobacteria bacterium]